MGTQSRDQYNYFTRCATVSAMIVGEKKIFIYVVSVMIMGGIMIYFGTVHERKEIRNGDGS